MAQYISNKRFYEKSLKQYGISAQGVHWKNQETQYIRFKVITSFLKERIENSSITDLGCGLGEYYNYLTTQGIVPKEYIGIDCERKMINNCKKRFPKIEFRLKNILYEDFEMSDFTVCSGAMNLMNFDQCSLFIKRAYRHSRKGFVFNFLQSLTLNGVQPYEILSVCEQLSDKIEFQEGYLDNDFTIFMVK